MTSYDFVSGRSWSLFGELGVGLGWMSDTPDEHVVDTGILPDGESFVAAVAWVGHAQWLLVLWGYWIDRHRGASAK